MKTSKPKKPLRAWVRYGTRKQVRSRHKDFNSIIEAAKWIIAYSNQLENAPVEEVIKLYALAGKQDPQESFLKGESK